MVDYTLTDGVITNKLGKYQLLEIRRICETNPKFRDVVANERELTKTALDMAIAGIPYDTNHVESALGQELSKLEIIKQEWKGYTGEEFVDSNVAFAKVFDSLGVPYGKTEAGNPSFNEYNLEKMPPHPLIDLILAHRESTKLAGTYYSSFLYYGANGKIHADMRQGGTRTGRVSYREPNMQNVPKFDEDELDNSQALQVRGCFKPPPDHCLFMPDYDQMEYRMMLDMAGEKELINLILTGLDVHDGTAQMMGTSRKAAKTINFMLLYGGGIQKLATALGIPFEDAKRLRQKYFHTLRMVQQWIYRTSNAARIKGFADNWFGRRNKIDKGFDYKAPNYVIQGGCADVVKIAMNRIHADIKKEGLKTKMLLQVHDELIFQLHKDELDYAKRIVEIMEAVYPAKLLPLTAGPGYSWSSWGEKIDGWPQPA